MSSRIVWVRLEPRGESVYAPGIEKEREERKIQNKCM